VPQAESAFHQEARGVPEAHDPALRLTSAVLIRASCSFSTETMPRLTSSSASDTPLSLLA
jgi:hypothetical protein